VDDLRSAESVFEEFERVAERLDKPGQELLRICCRSLHSGLETLAFAVKHMALKAAARTTIPLSPRERDVLVMEAEPKFPGLPPRRIESSMRESLALAIAVYARTRGSEPPLEKSPIGDPALPKCVLETVVIYDRLTHPTEENDLVITREDVATLKKVAKWARLLRPWLGLQRRAELAEAYEAMNLTLAEAKRKLMAR